MGLDRLSGEALADHVELLKARIMEGDSASFALVINMHLEPENVRKLSFKRLKVGIYGLVRRWGSRFAPGTRANLILARLLFGLAN